MGKKSKTKQTKSNPSKGNKVNDLIEQGFDYIQQLQLDSAQEVFHRALKLSPQDTRIMDIIAEVDLQLGLTDEAYELLCQSTTLSPLDNAQKWLNLAPLQDPVEALQSYKKGIEILTIDISKLENEGVCTFYDNFHLNI